MTARRVAKLNIGPQTDRYVKVAPSHPEFVKQMRTLTRELTDQILSIFQQFADASPEIMLDALQPTFDLSQMWCPEDTGLLKHSGYLEVTEFRGNPRVEMGYAKGNNPDYAVFVHENVEMQHKPPTRAKWFEQAVNTDMVNIADRLTEGYRAFANLGG